VFPNQECAGKPGHIETFASGNGVDVDINRDYSGFQETIATLAPPTNLIAMGYMHHSEYISFWQPRFPPPVVKTGVRP
jgi:hypothetical protein